MKRILNAAIAAATATLLGACGGTEEEPATQADIEVVAEPTGAMQDMPGMAGMQDGMMQRMQAHMGLMMGMPPDSMMAMMPEHRQMAANMLARMNRDMQQMDMPGDEAWTATVDSLRQDLTRMPEISAQELQEFMPGHHGRMMRLMAMHRSMMGNMPM